jgi:hypothetical protein
VVIGRTELVAGAVVLLAAGLTLGAVLLFSGGGDDDGSAGDGSPAGATQSGAPFLPSDAAGEAIVELARRSVESLPEGQWPRLYDAFTNEFQGRCPREEFVAAGETDAANLGGQLSLLHFKSLVDVTLGTDTASGVIVGELNGAEYTIQTAYALEDGVWKIAPAPDTSGCNGFNRLSG